MMLHVTLEGGQWPATGCGEWFNRNLTGAINVFHVLYHEFFERGLRYFLPDARIEITGTEISRTTLELVTRTDGKLALSWFGQDYVLEHPRGTFTENEMRVVVAVGNVLAARFRSFFNTTTAAATLALFRGLPGRSLHFGVPRSLHLSRRKRDSHRARTTSPTPSKCCAKARC